MRTWSLRAGDPLSLRLAADARLTVPDYVDDQIWELALDGGDPPALSLQTSYGLRARGMRLFPGFVLDGKHVTDPAQFLSPPTVRRFYPNYLRVDFSPFPDLEIQSEYWVPDSHTLAGRYVLRNLGPSSRRVRVILYAVLRPGEDPQAMSEAAVSGATILTGRTGGLAPVIFLSGGAVVERAPYPALAVNHELGPGDAKSVTWAHAGLKTLEASFEAARAAAGRVWDAEIARLELTNASLVEIETGDPDWDAALALAQKVALSGYVGPTRHLPHASFVLTRLPDRGYSERGDGRDYTLHWDGQTAAHAYLSLSQILPAAPELARGVLRNFLAERTADGAVDGKPGLGGQRAGTLCAPLLATLAWRVYQHTQDRELLEECFPRLLESLDAWFTEAHDRDQDGVPEWDHTIHAGFDDWPSFVRWQEWGQGLELTKAETPDLASYLYRECTSLIEIARLLDRLAVIQPLVARAERLRQTVEHSWYEVTSSYHHLDRDLHLSPHGHRLGDGRGQFTLAVQRSFDPPARVLIRSHGIEGLSHAVQVLIHGREEKGRSRVERLNERDFQWFWDRGTSTSENTYAEIEKIEVRGLSQDFSTEIWTADYGRQDQTLLLPLWAGIPDASRAGQVIRRTLKDPDRYWRLFGIPICSARDPAYAADNRQGCGGVSMLWNTMLGESLVDYGFREEAAELVRRLMQGPLHTLRLDGAFREAYNADQPQGLGERDHLAGLAPTGLFLYVLGVRLISPNKVWLAGHNPFPWPVTVRWRGLEIVRVPMGGTSVTFPDGQRGDVVGEEPCVVEQMG